MKRPTNKTKKMVGKIVMRLSLIAFITSILFWVWFDKKFNIGDSFYLEIDYFNTVCGILGIVGLYFAIYQIAELKTQEELIEETVNKTHIKIFKSNSLTTLTILRNELESFQMEVVTDVYSKEIIVSYTQKLSKFVNKINETNARQQNLPGFNQIDCKKCIPLFQEMISDCNQVLSDELYGKLQRSLFSTNIIQSLEILATCENSLKN
jgi:hypothetical protein